MLFDGKSGSDFWAWTADVPSQFFRRFTEVCRTCIHFCFGDVRLGWCYSPSCVQCTKYVNTGTAYACTHKDQDPYAPVPVLPFHHWYFPSVLNLTLRKTGTAPSHYHNL
jgi:hypothetical protein